MFDSQNIGYSLFIGFIVYTICYVYRKYPNKAWKEHSGFLWNYFLFFRNPLCSSIGILTSIALISINIIPTTAPDYYSTCAIIISFTLASMGWIISVKHTSTLHRRKQAFDLLKELKTKHHVDYLLMHQFVPPESRIEPKHLDTLLTAYKDKKKYISSHDYPVLWAIIRIANSYELLATAARLKEIDKPFIEKYVAPTLVFFYVRCLPIIHHYNNDDESVYEDLKWLVETEWKKRYQEETNHFLNPK